MKYTFEDFLKIIEDIGSPEGDSSIWLKKAWSLIEESGCNYCNSKLDYIKFYSLIFGFCDIYNEFTERIYGWSLGEYTVELNIDYEKMCDMLDDYQEDEEFVKDELKKYIDSFIFTSENQKYAWRLLYKKHGEMEIFAWLYYAMNSCLFTLEDYETDDFYYGDCENEEELEEAKENNEDYEKRKYYSSLSEKDLISEIISYVECIADADIMSTFSWIMDN